MAEDLKKPAEEFSLERLKRVAEELNKTGVEESRKENEKTPNPTVQKEEMKIAGTASSDLIQEKMKLEKILQEMNNLKSKICQRIELIKTIERRQKELNQQLVSARKENDFPDQIKESFENLKENIKF